MIRRAEAEEQDTMLRIDNRVCLVTGGGSGIGRATAVLLAQAGAAVYVGDKDSFAARETCDLLCAGLRGVPLDLDVTSLDSWTAAFKVILAGHERLDVLVNNAGISISKPIAELSFADWQHVMDVNLNGVFLGTKHALAAMTQGGSIINVSSVSGSKPFAAASAYCTSKAAIRMFSKTAAIECADAQNGVRINTVSPGGVKTPMWEKEAFFQDLVEQTGSRDKAYATLAQGRNSQAFLAASQIASTILYLASDASSHINGTEILLDQGHTL